MILSPTQSTGERPASTESETIRFLTALFEPGDFIARRPTDTWNEDGKRKSRVDYEGSGCWTMSNDLLTLSTLIKSAKIRSERERTNSFFGVCPRHGREGFEEKWQIRTVRVLWADLDHTTEEEALARCEKASLPVPSIVVSSGNGVHLYWLLSTPYLIDDVGDPPQVKKEWVEIDGKRKPIKYILVGSEKVYFKNPQTGKLISRNVPSLSAKAQHAQDVIQGMSVALGAIDRSQADKSGADAVQNLDRLLRLPGTLNRKDQRNGREPVPCVLVQCDPDLRYDFATFERFAQASPDAKRREKVRTVPLPAPRRMTPARQDKLGEKITACELAEPGQRSERDFALCAYAVENGYSADEVWSLCEGVGKFSERGREYFDRTWEKAEGECREKTYRKITGESKPKLKANRPQAQPADDSPLILGESIDISEETDALCATEEMTDLGNSRRFVHRNRGNALFCHQLNRWFIFDGKRWREDDRGEARRRAQATSRRIAAEAELSGDPSLTLWATSSQASKAIDAMLKEARCEGGFSILVDDLDKDKFLLNCANGTVDLRTGTLRPHDKNDRITKLCPTPFNPNAKCDQFEDFLSQLFNGSQSMIDFLWRSIGYWLTGDVREQKLWIFWGAGSNGKSTLIEILMAIMGNRQYAGPVADSLLIVNDHSEHPTVKADLFGLRVAACVEIDEGKRFAEATVKNLTGGDLIKARRMREDYWHFAPTHKLVLCTNHKPTIRGSDDGIRRRLLLVPFLQKFWDADKGETGPDHLKQDRTLKDRLLGNPELGFPGEREGILAWMVRGCLAWQQEGLCVPPEVIAASDSYVAEQDVIARFLEEECVVLDPAKVQSGRLYARYRTFCDNTGEKFVMTQKVFSERIIKRGFEIKKSNGSMWVYGIGLNDPVDER